jgi:peptidyl-prolyl cis-trans isomerase B (cyclophilin B)
MARRIASEWDHPSASEQSARVTNSGPPEPTADAPPSPTNALAITGLVSSLVFAALGIVFRHLVHKRNKRTGEHGRGLAIGGLVIGYAMTAISFISVIVLAFIIGTAARSLNQPATPKTPPNKPQPFRPMPVGSFSN